MMKFQLNLKWKVIVIPNEYFDKTIHLILRSILINRLFQSELKMREYIVVRALKLCLFRCIFMHTVWNSFNLFVASKTLSCIENHIWMLYNAHYCFIIHYHKLLPIFRTVSTIHNKKSASSFDIYTKSVYKKSLDFHELFFTKTGIYIAVCYVK